MSFRTTALVCQLVGTLFLTGCETTHSADDTRNQAVLISAPQVMDSKSPATISADIDTNEDPAFMYRERADGKFHIPAIDTKRLKPEHIRQTVSFSTDEPAGTIIVDQKARFLYYVLPEGKAVRYAVGVGPASRSFQGTATIAYKRAWPRWTPTANMIKRNPEHYGRFRNGVEGGPNNPMGARALYIHKNGQDTYYRIHGTNVPSSIGKAVSAGCIRLLAHDIIDLHDRVRPGARVIVQ